MTKKECLQVIEEAARDKRTVLSLNGNQLTALPPEIAQLTNLTTLNLSSNQLTTLPASLSQLSQLTVLYLHDNNQLGIPPEILGPSFQAVMRVVLTTRAQKDKISPASAAAILDYYFSHQAGQRQALNEAKVLFVGQGSVGKTSLVRRLVDNNFALCTGFGGTDKNLLKL